MGWKKWLKKPKQEFAVLTCDCNECGKEMRYEFDLVLGDKDAGTMVCSCGFKHGIRVVREGGKIRLEIHEPA